MWPRDLSGAADERAYSRKADQQTALFLLCDSESLSFNFLTRLPGVCCGGGRGFPPETLNGLTRNPLSCTR